MDIIAKFKAEIEKSEYEDYDLVFDIDDAKELIDSYDRLKAAFEKLRDTYAHHELASHRLILKNAWNEEAGLLPEKGEQEG